MSLKSLVNGYFSQLVDPMFQRDEQGREIVFPMGLGTRGRIVPDAATGQMLRERLRRGWMAYLFLWIPAVVVAMQVYPGLWAFLGMLVGSVGLALAMGLHVTRGLEVAERRMTIRNQAASIQQTYSLRRLVLSALCGVVLTAICALDLIIPGISQGQPAWFKPVAALSMVFFAVCTLMWSWYAISKWRQG